MCLFFIPHRWLAAAAATPLLLPPRHGDSSSLPGTEYIPRNYPPSIRSARPDYTCSFPSPPPFFSVMGAYVQPREIETERKMCPFNMDREVVVAQCYVGCNSTSDADKRKKTAGETKRETGPGFGR